MKTKPIIIITAIILFSILLAGTFSAGVLAGGYLTSVGFKPIGTHLLPDSTSEVAELESDITIQEPESLEDLFKPFWQTWDKVHEEFVEQPVDDELLMRGAISGMLESLDDDHTSYLDPDLQEQFEARLNGQEYEGIGAWVDIRGEYLTVIAPIPGSPAEKAGLKPGDQILAIDGEDMTGVDPELARQSVLGPKGSIVTLTIHRDGVDEPFDVDIKRDSILIPTVEGRILEDENIAYIQLYTFGSSTHNDLRKELKALMKQNPDGLILDLRNNGGGYLNSAISVVSEFIDEGIVMYEEYGDGTLEEFNAKRGGLATDIPMIVLINEGSASASEIVAGAIQDFDRGNLVGVISFGKGSVQSVTALVNDQGQIRITTARWLTPDKRQINRIGLEPDYIIEYTEEDFEADRDPQLEKAIELLTQ